LFLSMRAAIRAHVSATAATRQTTDGLRDEKIALARDYLAAAQSFLQQSTPRLVAIGGLSGSGKSTIANLLAPSLQSAPGARWLRTDVLRKRMAGVAPEAHLSQASYTPEANAAVYRRLLGDAAESLAAGRSVIVDGVFAEPAEREKIAGVAAAARVRFSGLWLTAAPEVLMDRVDARHSDASDADHDIVERQRTYAVGDLANWQILDASQPVKVVLKGAQRLLA
jgi:predicted kinase